MSHIDIQKVSITDLDKDCIVNAANAQLAAGGGVCGAIFRAAGYGPLTKACDAIGHCHTGHAVITPGFKLKAKCIIHAVGPIYRGGRDNEEALLYSCYQASLDLAKENGCHSIGFPLISAGIYGYPLDEAWQVAIQSCQDWIRKEDYEMEIVFAVLDDRIMKMGQRVLG